MQKTEEILSIEVIEWINNNQLHEAMNLTLMGASDEEDKRRRLIAIHLAVDWHKSFKNGLDGRSLPLNIEKTIRKFLLVEEHEETEDDQVELIWAKMCVHAAEFGYAKLKPDDYFTRALIAAYLAQLENGYSIEVIQTPIQKAIRKGLTTAFCKRERHYGVKQNGL